MLFVFNKINADQSWHWTQINKMVPANLVENKAPFFIPTLLSGSTVIVSNIVNYISTRNKRFVVQVKQEIKIGKKWDFPRQKITKMFTKIREELDNNIHVHSSATVQKINNNKSFWNQHNSDEIPK